MNSESDRFQTTITQIHGCIVANIQADLTEAVFAELRQSLLMRVERSVVQGVVFDCSALSVMDRTEFDDLRKLVQMVELLGTPCVLAGLNAGIVSYLVTVRADTEGLRSMLGLDEALNWFSANRNSK